MKKIVGTAIVVVLLILWTGFTCIDGETTSDSGLVGVAATVFVGIVAAVWAIFAVSSTSGLVSRIFGNVAKEESLTIWKVNLIYQSEGLVVFSIVYLYLR